MIVGSRRRQIKALVAIAATSDVRESGGTTMEAISALHWLLMWLVVTKLVYNAVSQILLVVSPVLGIIRGVQNASVLHSLLSVFVPMYGIIYYSVAKKRAEGAD